MCSNSSSWVESSSNKLVWGTIVIAVLFRLPFFFTPLTYAADIWRQADTASISYHFYHNGFQLFYPQIFWGGIGPGYVETEFQLYTFLVALFYVPFGEHVWLGRLISLLFSVGSMYFLYQLARSFFGVRSALLGLAFFAVTPLFIRYSVAFMPEATVLFFYIATLYYFHRWLEEQSSRYLVVVAITLSLALLVKPTSVHIGLILLCWAIHRRGWAVLKQSALWLTAVVALLPPFLWFLHARDLYLTYGNTFGLFSGGDSKFGRITDWLNSQFYISIIKLEIQWVFAGVGVFFALFGLRWAWKQHRHPVLFGWLVLALYYMIVARYAQQSWGIQYHIYALPYAALLVGLGMEWLLQQPSRWWKSTVLVGAILMLGYSGWVYADMLRTTQDDRMRCARVIKQTVPAQAKLIVSSDSEATDNGVPNNYQDPVVFFYSRRYGWSLPLEHHHPKRVKQLKRQGATYLIILKPEFLQRFRALGQYLKRHSQLIEAGSNKCMIFSLASSRVPVMR